MRAFRIAANLKPLNKPRSYSTTSSQSPKIHVCQLANMNFIRIGQRYYNPMFIKYFTINENGVEMVIANTESDSEYSSKNDKTIIFGPHYIESIKDFLKFGSERH